MPYKDKSDKQKSFRRYYSNHIDKERQRSINYYYNNQEVRKQKRRERHARQKSQKLWKISLGLIK